MKKRIRDDKPKRLHIFERDGFRCVYCAAVYRADDLTMDHVEPRVKGGDGSAGNLVTCCRTCNAEKGGAAAWAFLARRPDLRANFLILASAVWPRLRRAVEEEIERSTNRSEVPKL
ncbi:MAG: HNH endonuclease [Planctomycetaceae bacterium]